MINPLLRKCVKLLSEYEEQLPLKKRRSLYKCSSLPPPSCHLECVWRVDVEPFSASLLKDYLYEAYEEFLQFMSCYPEDDEIEKQADNLLWLLNWALFDRRIAEDLAMRWATEWPPWYWNRGVSILYKHHPSRVTARLFVAIAEGKFTPSVDVAYKLLNAWMVRFFDDFGLLMDIMAEECSLMEDGFSKTFFTLPSHLQLSLLLFWLEKDLQAGEDCFPVVKRVFKTWWRKTFIQTVYYKKE